MFSWIHAAAFLLFSTNTAFFAPRLTASRPMPPLPAKRSRGTPRLANRLLKRVRDFAQVKYDGVITKEVASFALDLLEVDRCGLDKNDRLILMTIIQKFGGGPVGLETLAAAVGEDSGTIEDVYEPYLVKNGFLNRTPKGRVATALAIEHFKQ